MTRLEKRQLTKFFHEELIQLSTPKAYQLQVKGNLKDRQVIMNRLNKVTKEALNSLKDLKCFVVSNKGTYHEVPIKDMYVQNSGDTHDNATTTKIKVDLRPPIPDIPQLEPMDDPRWMELKEIRKIDPVNHPSHYTSGKIEVIDFIEDQKLGFHLGNVVKYVARAGKKNPSKLKEDLKKAAWYLDRKIKSLSDDNA